MPNQAITCPWCGTNYAEFQSNCDNCGGSLPLPEDTREDEVEQRLQAPPAPPRSIPDRHVWRVLLADGWAITAGIFGLLGGIFLLVGVILTASIVAIFVGIPFAGLGLAFSAAGVGIGVWRYQWAQGILELLRTGASVRGEIVDLFENYHVQINGRYPWTIIYRFQAEGRELQGRVTTLSRPGLEQRPGRSVYVLYDPDDLQRNTIYPTPYGYYGGF